MTTTYLPWRMRVACCVGLLALEWVGIPAIRTILGG